MPEVIRLADHVSWADVDGVVIILDARTGRYLALPTDKRAVWLEHFSAGNVGKVTDSEFRSQLIDYGWLAEKAQKTRHAPRPTFLSKSSLCCLVVSYLRLRLFGFRSVLRWAECVGDGPDTEVLERCLARFTASEVLIPHRRGTEDCLPRSLALYRYLRAHGVAAEFFIGVKRFPFQAHAWVEAAGQPLLQTHSFSRTGSRTRIEQHFTQILKLS